MTGRYAHLAPANAREAVEKLQQVPITVPTAPVPEDRAGVTT